MTTVGIRELKQQTSKLVRLVRETGKEIQVTYHGQVVALLVPVKQVKHKNTARAWAQLDQLSIEIGAKWQKGLSAADAISQDRR